MTNTFQKLFLLTTVVSASFALSACDPQASGDSPNSGDSATISTGDQEGIVNGSKVTARNLLGESVVAIVAEQDQGEALCTGSILTNDMVLTAAHCVEGSPTAIELVFARQIQTSSEQQRRPVINFVQNPKWNAESETGIGDLAVLQFSGGLPAGYQPMTFAPPQFELAVGLDTLLMGYGVTNGESHAGAGVLRETSSEILGMQSPTLAITDGRTSGVCFGDSGGPALVKIGDGYAQWGVASSVTSEDCKAESVHTSVLSYEDWINRTMDQMRGNMNRPEMK